MALFLGRRDTRAWDGTVAVTAAVGSAGHSGTQLYENMVKRTDTYRVSLFQSTG